MLCPPEVARILINIATYGILHIRGQRWDGRGDDLVAESDHIHNLPALVADYSPDRLAYYWEVERPIYLRKRPECVAYFAQLWDELRPHVEGPGR
jgi:hypothetical protein